MNRTHIFYGSAILMILVFVAGWFTYNKLEADKLGELARQSNSLFMRPHSPTYGSLGARVLIVEFFDPSCETCRAFYPAVKGLVDANPGKVQLVIRYAPFHEGSDTAVRILEAARLQGDEMGQRAMAAEDAFGFAGRAGGETQHGRRVCLQRQHQLPGLEAPRLVRQLQG